MYYIWLLGWIWFMWGLPTHIFGVNVYTCIFDCVYGLASHMLGDISNDKSCGVADTHLVVVIPTLSVNMEKEWVFMASWQVGGMPWLWLSHQCWESNKDLNADKYPQNLFMDDSNSKSCWLCYKHVCKNARKVGIANLQIWVKDCWVLWARCFSFEVSYWGIIRETKQVKFCQKQTIVGP